MICIRHSQPFIYVHVPKTGGHTIDRFFISRNMVDIKTWHHTAAEQRALVYNPERFYSFATVRNPWDRMVSAYFWQMPGSNEHIPTPWGRSDISFRDYCYSDFSWYPNHERFHLKQQTEFTHGEQGQLVNTLMRFEHYGEDWGRVCAALELDNAKLPVMNNTEHLPYWYYYTPTLVERVENMFERDVRLLGYTFPYDRLKT